MDKNEYNEEIKTKVDTKNLDSEKIDTIKKDINIQINKKFDIFKNIIDKNNNEINSIKKELKIIKQEKNKLNELIKDLKIQNNLLENRLSSLNKKENGIDLNKSYMKKNPSLRYNSISYLNDDILYFINNENYCFKINKSFDFNSSRNKRQRIFKNYSYTTLKNKAVSSNLFSTLNSRSFPQKKDIREKKKK